MSGRNLVKRSDKWPAFSLHAVHLLACGCGAAADSFYSDAGPDGPPTKTADAEGDSSNGDIRSRDGTAEGALPTSACNPTSCTVVLFGGSEMVAFLGDTWTFAGTTWTQVPVSNPPPARYGPSTATLGNEVVLFGGEGSVLATSTVLNDTWRFNGTSWTNGSVLASNSPRARDFAAMATLGNEVVLFGGTEGSGSLLDDTWTFDGTSWAQMPVSNPPPARHFGTTATLGNEVVLFGGGGNSGALNDTWTFDGTSWTRLSISNPPPARSGAMMATLGNEVVLFGGSGSYAGSGAYLNDTWAFNGTSWNQVFVSSPPPARDGAMMATLGNEVVLFGGNGNSSALNDTWTFDGTSWTQVPVSNPPPARSLAAIAALP